MAVHEVFGIQLSGHGSTWRFQTDVVVVREGIAKQRRGSSLASAREDDCLAEVREVFQMIGEERVDLGQVGSLTSRFSGSPARACEKGGCYDEVLVGWGVQTG